MDNARWVNSKLGYLEQEVMMIPISRQRLRCMLLLLFCSGFFGCSVSVRPEIAKQDVPEDLREFILDWSQYPVVDFVLIGGSSSSTRVWMAKAWDIPVQNREFCVTNGEIFEYVSTGPFGNDLDTPFESSGSDRFTMAALNLEALPCEQIEGDAFFYLDDQDDLAHVRKIFSSISNLIELYKSEGSQSAESDGNFDLFRSMSGPYQEWLLGLEIEAPSEIDFVENSLGRSAVEVGYIMGSNDYIEIYTFILLQEQETFKVTGFSWGQPHINK